MVMINSLPSPSLLCKFLVLLVFTGWTGCSQASGFQKTLVFVSPFGDCCWWDCRRFTLLPYPFGLRKKLVSVALSSPAKRGNRSPNLSIGRHPMLPLFILRWLPCLLQSGLSSRYQMAPDDHPVSAELYYIPFMRLKLITLHQ